MHRLPLPTIMHVAMRHFKHSFIDSESRANQVPGWHLPHMLCVRPGCEVEKVGWLSASNSLLNAHRRDGREYQLRTAAACAFQMDSGPDGPPSQIFFTAPQETGWATTAVP